MSIAVRHGKDSSVNYEMQRAVVFLALFPGRQTLPQWLQHGEGRVRATQLTNIFSLTKSKDLVPA